MSLFSLDLWSCIFRSHSAGWWTAGAIPTQGQLVMEATVIHINIAQQLQSRCSPKIISSSSAPQNTCSLLKEPAWREMWWKIRMDRDKNLNWSWLKYLTFSGYTMLYRSLWLSEYINFMVSLILPLTLISLPTAFLPHQSFSSRHIDLLLVPKYARHSLL